MSSVQNKVSGINLKRIRLYEWSTAPPRVCRHPQAIPGHDLYLQRIEGEDCLT
jgi:hypothetical protein